MSLHVLSEVETSNTQSKKYLKIYFSTKQQTFHLLSLADKHPYFRDKGIGGSPFPPVKEPWPLNLQTVFSTT